MVILTALIVARKGKEKDLEKALLAVVDKTATEPGALEYKMHRSPDDPCRFFFYEAYKDQSALDAHAGSAHFQALLKVFADTLASDPVLEKFDPVKSIPAKK